MKLKTYSLWRHLKTGNLYRAIWFNMINATNGASEGQRMVEYRREDSEETGDENRYVRDQAEFLTKFEPVAEVFDDEPLEGT